MESLKEQVMINQFVLVAGCSSDQAKQFLQLNNWQFQTALSIFFQEATTSSQQYHQNGRFNPMCTPANTPATPPNFPETLLAFSKLSTSENKSGNNNMMGSSHTSINHASVVGNVNSCNPLNLQYHHCHHPQFASPTYDNLSK